MVMDPFSTALCNTLFRAITMTLMLPFTSLIKKCVYLIVPLDPAEEEDKGDFEKLDPRLLANPDMAFAAAEDVMNGMARKARKNVDRSINLLNSFTPEGFKKVQDLESTLNKYEEKLGKYLVKLTAAGVSYKQSKSVSKSLQAMADFEAIGDYALSVAEYAKTMSESKQKFSVEALDELNVIAASAEEAVNITVDAFISESSEDVNCVFALRELVSINGSQIKERHVKRLQSGDCSMELGFMQNDIIAAFQHIVDHCSAIALDIAKDSQKDFSIHRYLRRYQREIAPEYKEILEHYETKYAISNMAGSTISAEDIESVAPQGKMQTV
jgi:phosphate:Na+ symporter